jgi:glycosyltransferase involved in cell wall biosynthesis
MPKELTDVDGESICGIICIHDYLATSKNIEAILIQAKSIPIRLILVLDGGAKDYVNEINTLVSELKLSAQALVVISHENNPGGARNIGMQYNNSKWTCFWDSDDLPDLMQVSKLVTSQHDQGFDLIIGNYSIQDLKYESDSKPPTKIFTLQYSDLLRNLGIWRIIFRTEFVSGLEFPNFRMAEDQVFIYSVLNKQPSVFFSQEFTYLYRKNRTDGITSNRDAFEDIPNCLALILSMPTAWAKGINVDVARAISNLMIGVISRGSLVAKLKLSLFAIRNIPRPQISLAIWLTLPTLFKRIRSVKTND